VKNRERRITERGDQMCGRGAGRRGLQTVEKAPQGGIAARARCYARDLTAQVTSDANCPSNDPFG